MMARKVSAGKLRNLMCLSSDEGQFFMLAIDQRGSLQKALRSSLGRDPTFDDMSICKEIITGTLSPMATGVLTDPIYGLVGSLKLIPRDVGILLAYEHSGAAKSGPDGRELRSRLVDGWSVHLISRTGANAVKLLIQYHPDASDETRKHQQQIVRQVGQECMEQDLPFLLELTGYPLDSDDADTPQYAREKPSIVSRGAEEFSKPEYGVDILKLEFPANLKYTEEYGAAAIFDSRRREPVYSLKDVHGFCETVNSASRIPWVILSAAVNIEEFLVNAELACAHGASGFLCGRAIWKDSIGRFLQGPESMEHFLLETGVFNFSRAIAAAGRAMPWWDHPYYGGLDSIQVLDPVSRSTTQSGSSDQVHY